MFAGPCACLRDRGAYALDLAHVFRGLGAYAEHVSLLRKCAKICGNIRGLGAYAENVSLLRKCATRVFTSIHSLARPLVCFVCRFK